MGYREEILERGPLAYWKLEAPESDNLGSDSTKANWVSTSSYGFTPIGIDGVDSMAFMDAGTYIDFGHLNLRTNISKTSFSLEFWFNLNYSSAKNRRIPLIWKDFDLDGSYTNQTGYGFAVFAIPLDDSVFLEIYLFDDTDTPTFYRHILRKEDYEWYQLTLTTQVANDNDSYLHKLYLDGILISTTLRDRKITLPQLGNDNIYCNRTRHNGGFDTGQFYGYIDEVSVYDYALSEAEVTGTPRPNTPRTLEVTPTLATVQEYFTVDGIQHDFLPDLFSEVDGEYGVKANSFPTLDLKRIVVSHGNPREVAGQINRRKAFRQAWESVWSGPEQGFVDIWMRDQLFGLYTTQRHFWIQYDSEMHRVSARLHQVGGNYRVYYTPTYPIIPYGYNPLENRIRDYKNHVFVNGTLYDGTFIVDEETGVIVFDTDLDPSDEVTMNYMWRARVRIKDFNLEPSAEAPEVYVGSVVFEQVDFNLNDDPWLLTLPRDENRFYSLGPTDNTCTVATSLSSTPSSFASDGTIGMSEGSNTSQGSIVSDGTFPSIGTNNSGLQTFRNYRTFNGRIGGTIPEVDWYIGRASEMAQAGCSLDTRSDEGIFPILYQVYYNLSGPNDGSFFDFETDFMYFYVANNLPDIRSDAEIKGIQFDIQYWTRDFRIDDSRFPGQTLTVMDVKDTWVVPIVGGNALFDATHNKASSTSISKVIATPDLPYYENYALNTITYGGLGQTWGRTWTAEEIKGLFGVAIKLNVRAHGAFFQPAVYNSLANRANPVIWCSNYKVYYV